MTDYGTDFSCTTDLDTTLSTVSGPMVVVEAVVRRWSTPTGALLGDPNYGFDLSAYCNADVAPRDIAQLVSSLNAEAEKDERVLECTSSAVLGSDDVLTVTANLTLLDGETFTLVLAVSAVTVELLRVE
jgi:hypothetical protein